MSEQHRPTSSHDLSDAIYLLGDPGPCPGRRSWPEGDHDLPTIAQIRTVESLYPDEAEGLNIDVPGIYNQELQDLYDRGLYEHGFVGARALTLGLYAWAFAACDQNVAKGNPICNDCPMYEYMGNNAAQDFGNLQHEAAARGITAAEFDDITTKARIAITRQMKRAGS